MAKVIMGVGIPGSGKTTVLQAFAEKNGYTYICPDDIRQELSGDAKDQTRMREVWDIAHSRLEAALSRGETAVVDATFAKQHERQAFVAFAKEHGAEKVQGVFFNADFEIAKERNAQRGLAGGRNVPEHAIERMCRSLDEFPPELADGFDSVFELSTEQDLREVTMEHKGELLHKEFEKFS